MKSPIIFSASLLLAGALSAQDGYTNVIRMVERGVNGEPNVYWEMPGEIAATGTDVLVNEALPEGGATFVLRSIRHDPFEDFYIAETSVGAYLPQASIEVITHDEGPRGPRMRADQQYSLEVTVSGLWEASATESGFGLTDDNVGDFAKGVLLDFYAQDYPTGANSLPNGEITVSSHWQSSLVGNGSFPVNEGDLTFWSELSPLTPDKARGEEHFVISSADDVNEVIAQAKVEVWPVWEGNQQGLVNPQFLPYSFSGSEDEKVASTENVIEPDPNFQVVDGHETYNRDALPDVVFNWIDLFPSSTVRIIVNDADIPHPWGGRIVGGGERVFNEEGSFDHSITIHEDTWLYVMDAPGRYAVWMVTYTPGIGWEVGGEYGADGSLNPGGWVIPVRSGEINLRGSIHSLAE